MLIVTFLFQGKKKTKRSKYKSGDGKVQECNYETLPQDVESLQVSDTEETSDSQIGCVENIETAISDAFSEICDESSKLLDNVSEDHNEAQPDERSLNLEESNLRLVKSSKVSNYIHTNECKQGVSQSETELDEIQSPAPQLGQESSQADTSFESPLHLPSSPSVESAEDPLSLWIETNEETEIAKEASPSAPILLSSLKSAIQDNIHVVTPEEAATDKPYFPFINKEEDVEEVVKPFTLPQLAALYHNPELDVGEEFVSQFVETELRGGDALRHPLYELLLNYQQARSKLTVSNVELHSLKNECKEHQKHLWSMERCQVTEHGECQVW